MLGREQNQSIIEDLALLESVNDSAYVPIEIGYRSVVARMLLTLVMVQKLFGRVQRLVGSILYPDGR